MKKLLVVVDVQRDFFDPSGSLYVKGSEVLPERIARLAGDYDACIFTLDWHPADHCSFAAQGGIWPSHCVAYTQGAGLADEFAPLLALPHTLLFFKGTQQDKEQYGAFGKLEGGPVYELLTEAAEIDVCGIAGDYCVKESCANVLKIARNAKVSLLADCICSIDGGEALEAFAAASGVAVKR